MKKDLLSSTIDEYTKTPKKQRTFLHDAVECAGMGIKALEQDNFTRCFEPIPHYEMDSCRVLYIFSVFIRYLILFPLRLFFLIICTLIFIPIYIFYIIRNYDPEKIFLLYCNVFLLSFGAKIHHHGKKARMGIPHVYVANHTSFVDYIILSSHKFCHAAVSEGHGGLFGFVFSKILSRIGSISFKRSEKLDRELVMEKMKAYISSNTPTPMLVFPEGTCVNNKYTVLFQKGAFSLGVPVIPVAIKFRRNLMDPYWNRRKHNFTEHLLYLMSRWRLEADVWWLPKEERRKDESITDFAMRIKELISERGGLKNVLWNGYFKSSPVLRDREILREAYRRVYSRRENVKRRPTISSEHRFNSRLLIDIAGKGLKELKKYLNTHKIIFHEKNEFDGIAEKVYFGKYTYDEFIDLVLKEYLVMKGENNYENKNADAWLGYRGSLFQNNECRCKDLVENQKVLQKNIFKSCRSEFSDCHGL